MAYSRSLRIICVALGAAVVLTMLGAPAAHAAQPSVVVVLSDTTTPVKIWHPYVVHVRLEAPDGTPLVGRQVKVFNDSDQRWICCSPPPTFTTDANGEVSTTIYPVGNSVNPVRFAAYWYGDATYDKAITEWLLPIVGYSTDLPISAPARVTSGAAIPVSLSAVRTDPEASSRGCIVGAVVQLDVSGPSSLTTTATVQSDASGNCGATVNLPASLLPGTYTLTASTGHDGWNFKDEPLTVVRSLQVDWKRVFTDAKGFGTVYLAPSAQAYRVRLTSGIDSGAVYAGADLTQTSVMVGGVQVARDSLDHVEGANRAAGTFYSTGTFSASGVQDGTSWTLSR